MDHSDFKKAWNEKSRKIEVVRPKALHVLSQGLLPKKYSYAHSFWSTIWMLSFPAGILLAVFYMWWVGLIFLIFIPQMLSASVKQSAMDFVLEYALEDESFYNLAVSNGIIIVE